MDIYNALGRDRTLFVSRYLDDEVHKHSNCFFAINKMSYCIDLKSCNQLIASLIWLQGQNNKDPITLYFNVPGYELYYFFNDLR
jgi:ATP-dependent protease ClpP protease subunit